MSQDAGPWTTSPDTTRRDQLTNTNDTQMLTYVSWPPLLTLLLSADQKPGASPITSASTLRCPHCRKDFLISAGPSPTSGSDTSPPVSLRAPTLLNPRV